MKFVNKKNTSHLSHMVIGQGHTIMLGDIPDNVNNNDDNLLKLNENLFSWKEASKETVSSFGLFGGDLNYHTYYPELDVKDLTTHDKEFITPMFRLLSATVVSKNYNPTDFSKNNVLRNSMKMLLGQTVNCDHSTDVGNAIGAVSKVLWQEAYETKEGFKIPAGINGVLKIDGKANPRIARGILMDPPSIHSNSVTVQFRWDKSHPQLDDRDFYDKMGSYDANGNLICRVVTEIVRYLETSLVSHGADSFAQKIGEDGQIVNPAFAHKTWNSFSEYRDDKSKDYFFFDMKQDTDYYQEQNNDTPGINYNNSQTSNSPMNEELQKFLDRLFGNDMLVLSEGKEASVEEAISLISDMISDKTSLSGKVTNLEAQVTTLTEKVTNLEAEKVSLIAKADLGTAYITKLRETSVANYRKMQGSKFDENDPILTMLNSETTGAAQLEALNKSYEARLEELYPMHCTKCGSKEVSRASSLAEDHSVDPDNDDTVKNSEVKSTNEALSSLIKNKQRYGAE